MTAKKGLPENLYIGKIRVKKHMDGYLGYLNEDDYCVSEYAYIEVASEVTKARGWEYTGMSLFVAQLAESEVAGGIKWIFDGNYILPVEEGE